MCGPLRLTQAGYVSILINVSFDNRPHLFEIAHPSPGHITDTSYANSPADMRLTDCNDDVTVSKSMKYMEWY